MLPEKHTSLLFIPYPVLLALKIFQKKKNNKTAGLIQFLSWGTVSKVTSFSKSTDRSRTLNMQMNRVSH